ncbi:unnamed protein product, partial [Staurois parvus]
MSARSCDQLCPITADHMALMISALMISEAPAVATCQCPSVPAASAEQCHLPVPHISAYQCTSMPHISAHLCQSVPLINANQFHLSVLPISAIYQCQSVPPISASQCCLSVRIS